jgi:hypothetical protein
MRNDQIKIKTNDKKEEVESLIFSCKSAIDIC